MEDTNFDELCGIAITELGLSTLEFYQLTPIEFKYALQRNAEKRKNEIRTQYEVARFIAFHIWNSAGQTLKKEATTYKDIVIFPWEEGKEKQTVEQMKQQLQRLAFATRNKPDRSVIKKKK